MSESKDMKLFFESLKEFSNNLMEHSKNLQESSGFMKKDLTKIEVNNKSAQNSFSRLQEFINDENITDVLINKHDEVFVERQGQSLDKSDFTFASEESVNNLATYLAKKVGRVLSIDNPYVDARLEDGSRINIVIPPISADGTCISIRKFMDKKIDLGSMIQSGCLSARMAELIAMSVASRLNIVISGGTGTGKTTLLNAISNHISEKERIVTIEDSLELKLKKPHVVRLEARPATTDKPNSAVTIRQLVANALRMRPDRIIIGETRGSEAFDMIQAMNTGHEGSMTTLHANKPRDVISRLENMINMGNTNLPPKAIRTQIASAIDLIVQVRRSEDGKRYIEYVTEIAGLEGDMISMQDIFVKRDDNYVWSGILPRFLPKLVEKGYKEKINKTFNINLG